MKLKISIDCSKIHLFKVDVIKSLALRSFIGLTLLTNQGCFKSVNPDITNSDNSAVSSRKSSGLISLSSTRKIYLSDISSRHPDLTKLVIRSGPHNSIVLSGDEARELNHVSIRSPSGSNGITIIAYKNENIISMRKLK